MGTNFQSIITEFDNNFKSLLSLILLKFCDFDAFSHFLNKTLAFCY